MSDNKAWSGKTGGTRGMQLSLIRIFRYIDPMWAYPFVWIWILGYIVFAPATRRGIYYYWHNRRGLRPIAAAWNLYMNYLEFGKVILDRFAAYAGRKIEVRVEGEEILDALYEKPAGFVVLSSHIGNQELAGYTFRAKRPMDILSYEGDTPTVNENRRAAFAKMGMNVIGMQKDGSHVLEMHNALADGHVLSIHADRLFFDSKAMHMVILGEEAALPVGPFRVAVTEDVAVVCMYMMREGHNRYTLYIRQLTDGHYIHTRRDEQARELAKLWVQATEEIINRYPRQWFHFYNFWE